MTAQVNFKFACGFFCVVEYINYVRLVTVRSKRRGKLFDRRTGKSEFKFSIGADFLNRDVTGRV